MIDVILAAALFGISAPLLKLLIADVDALVLAGLLYLGAGAALATLWGATRLRGTPSREAPIERRDLPWLGGAVFAGGVAAPVFLLLGLARTPAATASLLLNFEAVTTAWIAALVFREATGRTVWAATGLVAAGGILLSLDVGGTWGVSSGALWILAATVMWGLDNNLTARVSLRDPKRIVAIKGLTAGAFSLSLGVALGHPLPPFSQAAAALALGAVSYGVSIALFVRALRRLGAARTGALFGLAPFVGATLSLVVFRSPPPVAFYPAAALMLLAAFLLARERHEHVHDHVGLVHAHAHVHDPHHAHGHEAGQDAAEPHAHVHRHTPLRHAHSHRPDAHHGHRHPTNE